MAAPAGVSEGIPHEPAKAGQARAELAVAQAGETEPPEAGPTEAVPTEAVPQGAGTAGAVPVPTDVVPLPAEPGDGELVSASDGDVASTEAEAETDAAEPGEPGLGAQPGSRDISPLAVAGIILGVIALVGVAVGVLAVVTHGFRPKTVITYLPAAVFGLRAGQCIDSSANALNVTVLSCARPHDAEVFATFSLPTTNWPGASTVQQDAADGCGSRYGSYVDPQLAAVSLTQEYVYPNEAAWQAGERTVVCEVRAVDGQLAGSVRAKS